MDLTFNKMTFLHCFIALLSIEFVSSSPFSFEKLDVPPREKINFDFAWRFILGEQDAKAQCPETYFTHNLSSVECYGLHPNSATSPDDCRNACCADIMCATWQYDSTKGCWIGQSDDCNHPNNAWVGGSRDIPGKPPPLTPNGPTS